MKLSNFFLLVLFAVIWTSTAPICRSQDEAPANAVGEDRPAPPPPEAAEAQTPAAAMPTGRIAGAYEPTAIERNEKKSAQSLKIAENGRALVPIVISSKSGSLTRKYATEIADFLNKMTGATFEIQFSDGQNFDYHPPVVTTYVPAAVRNAAAVAVIERDKANAQKPAEKLPENGIVLGTAAEFETPVELKEGLALRGAFHGREAFAIRTNSKRVLLFANQDRGLNHVETRFLEEMGCRWFTPGAHWEILPENKNLSFGLDITDRPSIGSRIIAFMDGFGISEERGAQDKWQRRNYVGTSFSGGAGHMWRIIILAHQAEIREHPEYMALVNGKRQYLWVTGPDGKEYIPKPNSDACKLEMGNPVVRQWFVDYAIDAFKRNPDAEMVSVSPNDAGGFSQSPESRALGNGSTSDAVFTMVNEVARALKKEFPGQGKMVACYAYREVAGPPSFPLEDNVYIELATLFNMSGIPSAQLLEMWPEKVKNMGVYRYFSYYDAGGSGIPGGPVASVEWVTSTIRSDYARHTAAIFAQSSNAFAFQMRGYLVATRLMWNPNADPDEILQDFYDKAYGPAGPPMKRFYERLGYEAKRPRNLYTFAAARRDLDEATKLAKGREDILWRIADIKQYLHWNFLYGALNEIKGNTPEIKQKYADAIKNLFRAGQAMAPTYMTQWNMLQKRSGSLLKYVNKADLPNLYKDVPEPTLESVEADFQSDLKTMPTREIPYQDFDLTDLVPVEFPPTTGLRDAAPLPPLHPGLFPNPDPTQTYEYYVYGMPLHMFYSFHGEPIEVTMKAGIKLLRDGSVGWTLSRPDGKGAWEKLTEGLIPMDQVPHPVSIPVPGKGAYALAFNTGRLAGIINYKTSGPVTVTATGSKIWSPYFYVPKGTKEIWMDYVVPATLLQPDGKEAKVNPGVNAVPVPPGMDGQLWRVTPTPGYWSQAFHNIPNLIAPVPAALMVPRAVAIKDGLKIREK